MFRLMERWTACRTAAFLAATTYGSAGCLLAEHANPPYLIGAAWLPAAVGLLWQIVEQPRFSLAVRMSVVLTMIILGGDFQMVYHIGLLWLLAISCEWRWRRRTPDPVRIGNALGHCSLVAALTIGLSAVQWLPTTARVLQSTRWQPLLANESATPADDDDQRFEFSVGPWRWGELLWPNVGGKLYPENTRWMQALPAEGRVWAPSLYLGSLAMVCLLSTLYRFRSADTRTRWAVWTTVAAALAGLGMYGGGWLLAECRWLGVIPEGRPLAWPVLGPYWLMTKALPLYGGFRYPGKLWTIATFGLATLTGIAYARVHDDRPRLVHVAAGLVILHTLTLAVIYLNRGVFEAWLRQTNTVDLVFGPLQVEPATAGLLQSVVHGWLAAGLLWLLLRRGDTRTGRLLLLLFVAGDLFVANQWMVAAGRIEDVRSAVSLQEPGSPPRRLYRGDRHRWRPHSWQDRSCPQRLAEVMTWDIATLYPQYHLAFGGLIEANVTIAARDWTAFSAVARSMGPQRADGRREIASQVLRVLGVQSMILPAPPGNGSSEGRPLAEDARWIESPRPFPRAWIVHEVIRFPQLHRKSGSELQARMRAIWFPDQERDWRRTAIVESDREEDAFDTLATPGESCRLVEYSPQHVRLAVRLQTQGQVVLSDRYDTGWRAEARHVGESTWHTLRSLRTNGILRSVRLPPGEWEVMWTYRPTTFWLGLVMSGVAWLWLLGWCIMPRKRTRRLP